MNKRLIGSLAVVAALIVTIGIVVLLGLNSADNEDYKYTSNAEGSLKSESNYVGAQSCQSCHLEEYRQWSESDHFKAMQLANQDSVLGDFSNTSVSFHNITSRLYRDEQKYLINTTNRSGEQQSFEIKYTFGYYPLQQYLVETQNGHVQALNIAWDSREIEQGGQRWFHLQAQEEITPEHPFFWTNHFQNWNSRCADCHSTNLQRNYKAADNSFNTTFSDTTVACEACHGAGSEHVELANSNKLSSSEDKGFAIAPSAKLQWQFNQNSDIAKAKGTRNQDDLNMCGACHALRGKLDGSQSNNDFHNQNRLQLINQDRYFFDGQTKQEAFVVGSFLQSKMHHKGVTCSNCHNPHTGKVLADDNGLCTQCHKPQVYDQTEHHRHSETSTGALCVNCHMPEKTVMQVDARRDHSFTIPRPDMSLSLGVPNACTQCHQDKDNTWAQERAVEWGFTPSGDHWAHLLHRASQNDVLVTRSAAQAILDTGLPPLIRASLLEHLAPFPSRVSADIARQGLLDQNPLVRRGAVAALRGHPAETRWQTLLPHIADSNLGVRVQIAQTLSDVFGSLTYQQQAQLASLIDEYRTTLLLSEDAVSTQLNIADLELRLGNLAQAELAYQQALKIEPAYVPALLNLAELYRSSGRIADERPLLLKAVSIAPDSGAAQHSLGLFFVRQQDYASAIKYLKLATKQNDAAPYYAYVYSVALENQGQMDEAIASLKSADDLWPNQYEILLTLVLYLEKSGNDQQILPYLSKLSAIAPSAPAVQQLVSKYRGG
ncbi:MAG: tetratricopeptide (TPR) repeat protein [Cryomorphaceae bacterium]|jgi:tetratricopeptide (TPR) repeat protein